MDDNRSDKTLETLFSAARDRAPAPSDAFMARLMDDVDAATPAAPSRIRPETTSRLLGGVKAWFAASGLSGAAVLGVWIGFVMPEVISDFTLLSEDTVDLYTFLPGADLTVAAIGE